MGLTRQWLETKPAVTDKIKDGPAEFQARWKDIRELLNSAGIVCDGANPLSEQGRMAVNASGIASPKIYKSDRVTEILSFADAAATFLAAYPLIGSKNIPETMVVDGVIGLDAKGYKRAMEPFRIWESNPVDTKVNVKSGIYVKTGGVTTGIHAGGQLTIGTAPLTLPAAGNHAYYAIVVNGAGTLTAYKGAEVILANPPAAPIIDYGDNLIGIIEIKDTSVNFSLATSGANAFLIQDGRVDAYSSRVDVRQVAEKKTGTYTNYTDTTADSKAITTTGGLVLAIGWIRTGSSTNYAFGRAGVALPLFQGITVGFSFGIEALAAGTYTYQLRTGPAPGAIEATRIWLIELGPTAVV